jgi:hypothetical protein
MALRVPTILFRSCAEAGCKPKPMAASIAVKPTAKHDLARIFYSPPAWAT